MAGSSIYVVAAMAGNFRQESGINPGIWQNLTESAWTDLLVGYGLGQWTNTGGDQYGRLYQLYAWCKANGYSVDDGDAQCLYLTVENVWYSTGDYAGKFTSLSDFLASDSTDIEFLTHAWSIGWEGIKDDSWDLRVTYARTCYEYILEHYDDESITDWVSGNFYSSEAQVLNNAVMLWRYFGTDTPPTPTPHPTSRTSDHLWMYLRCPALYGRR